MKNNEKKEKKPKLDPKDINPEDILKDADKILNFIDEFESIDHNTADVSKLLISLIILLASFNTSSGLISDFFITYIFYFIT